ncbi:hypothetical protein [Defluviicoccus vanus]|uniref:Uncharacterized protein n=1 Tax=Defluviicoccus vanus TaxID=111831 RepID=A0A7H1N2E5_9PROT|nr:hypothetical protein [Defluviicoccus vanus]QNT69881.1 hypothetical protein HQ394_11810 [Defluviicoccus vanus]
MINFSEPPAAGSTLTLRRRIVIQRTTDFQESGELRARVLNYELDYLTAALQQVEDATERSVRLLPADADASLTLPMKSDRAGKTLSFDAEGNVTVATVSASAVMQSLDDIAAGVTNQHFTTADKAKLDSVATGAQVNPASLDEVPDSPSRLAMTVDERSKLQAIANPAAATDAEITAGTATATRTVSPAQIKSAVITHSPVTTVAGRSGAVTLSQADVAGTVPSARAITVGSGLIGGGDLSADRSIAVNLAAAGGSAGTATTVARADHSHAAATTTVDGLFAAIDKQKLDSVAAGAQVNPASLDEVPDSPNRLAMTADERGKLQGVDTGAQVNPASLDELTDGKTRLAMTVEERSKLQAITANADANPAAATDAEITAGTATATRTVSPAQIKSAVITHSPVTTVAGRSGAVTLSQADVAGTVPSARAITVGSGLTGGGDLSADRSIAVNLAAAGGSAGTANTVARADHSHAAATTTVDGLLAAADKQKLDSVAAGAQVNPAAATDAEITTGTATATRTVSPAQIKAAVTIHAPVTTVAGRSGAVTLSQADVAGIVPSARAITVGSGLTGGGDLSADRSIAVNLAAAGGSAGTANTPSPAPTTATP